MFMLYAIVLGVLVGLLVGGRLDRLSTLRFHWAPLAIAALLIQVVLFSGRITAGIGDAGPPIYVASSAAVLVVVLRNLRIVGLPLVALGAASNLAAIVANGGFMPATPGALATLGKSVGADYSNSREFAAAAVAPLGDVFVMPAVMPFANVFSIGDLLIGVGVFVAILWTMRSAPRPGPMDTAEAPIPGRPRSAGGVVRSDTSPERSAEEVLRNH